MLRKPENTLSPTPKNPPHKSWEEILTTTIMFMGVKGALVIPTQPLFNIMNQQFKNPTYTFINALKLLWKEQRMLAGISTSACGEIAKAGLKAAVLQFVPSISNDILTYTSLYTSSNGTNKFLQNNLSAFMCTAVTCVVLGPLDMVKTQASLKTRHEQGAVRELMNGITSQKGITNKINALYQGFWANSCKQGVIFWGLYNFKSVGSEIANYILPDNTHPLYKNLGASIIAGSTTALLSLRFDLARTIIQTAPPSNKPSFMEALFFPSKSKVALPGLWAKLMLGILGQVLNAGVVPTSPSGRHT